MTTHMYDFPPIAENTPRVTAVLRDLSARLLKGVEGKEPLPEWAALLVKEGMAAAGLGGTFATASTGRPPALEGGVFVEGGAEAASVDVDTELEAPPEESAPSATEMDEAAGAHPDGVSGDPGAKATRHSLDDESIVEEPESDGSASDVAAPPVEGDASLGAMSQDVIERMMRDGADEL